jgi:uncharacterized membrane protein
MKIKLWDYSNRWGNIQGIICPLFSLFWTIIGALYYFVIDPFVIGWVQWFVNNIAFAFVVGFFFGVFMVDLGHSVNISVRIRQFAKKNNVVVAFEKLKESVKDSWEKVKDNVKDNVIDNAKIKKHSFIFPFRTRKGLEEELINYVKHNAGK